MAYRNRYINTDSVNPGLPTWTSYQQQTSATDPYTTEDDPKQTSRIQDLFDLLYGTGRTRRREPLSDLGSILGAFSQGRKADRIVGGNARSTFDRMMLDREEAMNRMGVLAQEGRNQNENDILRRINIANYVIRQGSQPSPQSDLPQYSFSPKPPTQEEVEAAVTLRDQLVKRLEAGSFTPEWSYQPTLTGDRPGKLESITSYGGAIASLLGIPVGKQGATIGAKVGSGLKGAGKFLLWLLGGRGSKGGGAQTTADKSPGHDDYSPLYQ